MRNRGVRAEKRAEFFSVVNPDLVGPGTFFKIQNYLFRIRNLIKMKEQVNN